MNETQAYEKHESFKAELTQLLNRYSLENGSNTPDFLLADYLVQCLAVFDVTIAHREQWYGRPLRGRPAVRECLEVPSPIMGVDPDDSC